METFIYFVSIVFQIAAMVFCVLMMRVRTYRVPWAILFSALTVMLLFRSLLMAFPELRVADSMKIFTALSALTVSMLLFFALFSIRKLAKLEQRNQRVYQAIGDSIDYGVWISDTNGANVYFSPSFLKLVGMTQAQCNAGGWGEALHPDERAATLEAWQECVRSGRNWYREHRFKGVDEKWHPVLACGAPVRDSKDQITCWAGIVLDIRQLKEAEDREREARTVAERQSRMKDEFLATVSHELRTPLNAIVGWTQLVQRQGNDPQMLSEAIEVIERNARAQWRLIEDLLDMSRIISGKMRLEPRQIMPAEFIEAAIETVTPAAGAKGIEIRKALDPQAGPVLGDASRLQQVIWNLLSNAIKFTPRGGRIEVILNRLDSHVEISVTDTGQGMQSEFLPYLFNRFRQADASTTRRHAGLGLGLAIVKNLVELHGGHVQAHSPGENQGATFAVTLPLPVAEAGQPALREGGGNGQNLRRAGSADFTGIRALIVDDDADARKLLTRLLDECKAEVLSAASAADAERLMAEFQPNVIISDIGMPGYDGFQFIESLRARGVTTPAIALSALARPEDRLRALRSGFQMHLAKPIEPAELIAVVGSVSSRPGRPADGNPA